MNSVKRFEDLQVWKESIELSITIYQNTLSEMLNKDFVLREQIIKSAISIPSNIAEGFEREGNKEFVNFLTMSKGSAGEVRSQLIRAFDRNYIDEEVFSFLKSETISLSKKLSGFINYLKNSEHKGNKFNRKND